MSNFCSAQEYLYNHYDARDGLAGSTAYLINQDKDGFLWIGTENGLSCFDGRTFKNYSRKDGLPTNEIFQAWQDSRGTCAIFYKSAACIGTLEGLYMLQLPS